MDELIALLGGPPPYSLEPLVGLTQRHLDMIAAMTSGQDDAYDESEAIRLAERFESLVALLSDPYFYQDDLRTFDIDAVWPSHLRHLPASLMDMKEFIWNRLRAPSPKLRDNEENCPHCRWIWDRAARGRQQRWMRRSHSFHYAAVDNAFLCAQDKWPDFATLRNRHESGCSFCGFLRDCILERKFQLQDLVRPDSIVWVWLSFHWFVSPGQEGAEKLEPGILRFAMISVGTEASFRRYEIMSLRLESDDALAKTELNAAHPVHSDPLNSESLGKIRKHLDLAHHQPPNPYFLPKRLLHIESFSPALGKIVDASNIQNSQENDRTQYAALSYCWGERDKAQYQPRLTSSTAGQFYHRFGELDMSPVMMDAFKVCQSLSIRYLWIDSLCIQQDDTEDWEQNSFDMTYVYTNAQVTICAASSDSCMDGFLNSRKSHPSWKFQSYNNQGECGLVSLRPMPWSGHREWEYFQWRENPLSQDLKVSRWVERGWTFQERTQGRKKLFFGATMWHCQVDNVIHFENGDIDEVRSHSAGRTDKVERLITVGPALSHANHKIQAYNLWNSLIPEVSTLRWTDERDVLPGLSGLARVFQQSNNDTYIAGHWKGDLACSLIWSVNPKETDLLDFVNGCKTTAHPRSAPYWSWCSRDKRVGPMIYDGVNLLCRVRSHLWEESRLIDYNVVLDGSNNEFGRLKSAALHMVGRLCPIVLLLREDVATIWCRTQGGHNIHVRLDWVPIFDINNQCVCDEWPHAKLRLLLISSCCSDWPDHSSELEDHLCRRQYRNTFMDDLEKDSADASRDCKFCQEKGRVRDAYGLLIYPADDVEGQEQQGRRRYYRVGVFLARAPHGGSKIFDAIEEEDIELI